MAIDIKRIEQEDIEDAPYRNKHLSDWRPQQENKVKIADDGIEVKANEQ